MYLCLCSHRCRSCQKVLFRYFEAPPWLIEEPDGTERTGSQGPCLPCLPSRKAPEDTEVLGAWNRKAPRWAVVTDPTCGEAVHIARLLAFDVNIDPTSPHSVYSTLGCK